MLTANVSPIIIRRHLSQVHEKFHCDLCVTNQKLFTFEHITYTRKELVKHKRSRDGTLDFGLISTIFQSI